MMRRIRWFVVTLVLFAPVVASAGSPSQDPDGLVSAAPTMFGWFDVIAQVLVVYLGA